MPFINSVRGTYGAQGRFGAVGAVVASGGTVTSSDGYVIHTFNSNGTFTLTSAPSGTLFDYLMVAGGGGGGAGNGNNSAHPAGGAGGLIYRSGESLTAGTYAVVVGPGGNALPGGSFANAQYSNPGGNTTFNGLTALGGGGGVNGQYNTLPGQSGGSGGGAQHADVTNPAIVGGAATQPGSASGGFGSKGGDGPVSGSGGPCWIGGGGGGAGGAGATGTNGSGANQNVGGEGGIGRQYSISGTSKYYAGGGGGGTTFNNDSQCLYFPPGGLGGGGRGYGHGAAGNNGRNGGDAFGNLGGGGGGATSGNDTYLTQSLRGGNGSAGTVIIRYSNSFSIETPQTVPGLVAWYDASTSSNFTFSSSTNISTWTDKAGNGYTLTGTNSPQFVAGVQNGLGVTRYVATSNQYFQNNALPFLPERTIFVVRKFSSTAQQPVVGFPTRFPNTWRGLYMFNTSEYGFNTWNGDSWGTASFSASTFQIDTATFRETSPTPFDSTWELRINGSVRSLSNLRGTSLDRQQYSNGIYVARGGEAGGVNNNMTGDIAEIIIYDTVLNSTQKSAVESYLTTKWSVS